MRDATWRVVVDDPRLLTLVVVELQGEGLSGGQLPRRRFARRVEVVDVGAVRAAAGGGAGVLAEVTVGRYLSVRSSSAM